MELKTDYKDDIPKTENRRYQMIHNDDGTVSFLDVTEYTQVGDTFGAGDVNATNKAVNGKVESTDIVNHNLVTEHGFAADALYVKEQFSEQNKNLKGLEVYTDPQVIYLVSSNSPYSDENKKYVLADSDSGRSMLVDAETYTANTISGDFYSLGGADSVSPFSRNTKVLHGVVSAYVAGYSICYPEITFPEEFSVIPQLGGYITDIEGDRGPTNSVTNPKVQTSGGTRTKTNGTLKIYNDSRDGSSFKLHWVAVGLENFPSDSLNIYTWSS